MSEKIKAIKGHCERSKEVFEWLKEQGLKNFDILPTNDQLLYFVKPDGDLGYVAEYHFDFLFDIVELPRYRKSYFYIDSTFVIVATTDTYNSFDNTRYQYGNYFSSHEEAEAFRDKLINFFNKEK